MEWDPEEEKIPGGACYSAGRSTSCTFDPVDTMTLSEVDVLGCCMETGKGWIEAHRENPWWLCCFLKHSFIELLYPHVINCIFLMYGILCLIHIYTCETITIIKILNKHIYHPCKTSLTFLSSLPPAFSVSRKPPICFPFMRLSYELNHAISKCSLCLVSFT